MRYFRRALDRIRRAVDERLDGEVGTKAYAVAAALRLIDVGLVRTGNEESARLDRRGATALHADHLEVCDEDEPYITIEYTARGGRLRTVVVEDDQLVRVSGNTGAVARASYVHPLVLEADDAAIEDAWRRSRRSVRARHRMRRWPR